MTIVETKTVARSPLETKSAILPVRSKWHCFQVTKSECNVTTDPVVKSALILVKKNWGEMSLKRIDVVKSIPYTKQGNPESRRREQTPRELPGVDKQCSSSGCLLCGSAASWSPSRDRSSDPMRS